MAILNGFYNIMLTVDAQEHLRSLEVEEYCTSSHNQTGIVVWLTGISGAGKTTVADAMAGKLSRRLPELVLVDGNVIRDLFGASLGFDEEARVEQIGRIQRIAKFLAEQGQCVVVDKARLNSMAAPRAGAYLDGGPQVIAPPLGQLLKLKKRRPKLCCKWVAK